MKALACFSDKDAPLSLVYDQLKLPQSSVVVQMKPSDPKLSDSRLLRFVQNASRYCFDKKTKKMVYISGTCSTPIIKDAIRVGNAVVDRTFYENRAKAVPVSTAKEHNPSASSSKEPGPVPMYSSRTKTPYTTSLLTASQSVSDESGDEVLTQTNVQHPHSSSKSITWDSYSTKALLDAFEEYKGTHTTIVLKLMYKFVAESLMKSGIFKHIDVSQVENKYRGLKRLFKRHIDDQDTSGASGKTLELETEMFAAFGTQEDIRPSVLLGTSGGLKRGRSEEEVDNEDTIQHKRIKFQKSKVPPMVQMLRDINEEKKRSDQIKSDAYNARSKILQDGFCMLAEAIKASRH